MTLMGEPVLQPQPGAAAPGGAPTPGGGGMQPSGPPSGGSQAGIAGAATPPNANAQVAANQPNQPSMPKNAMTHQPFNTQTGGLQ
jgi:hypothetical protein